MNFILSFLFMTLALSGVFFEVGGYVNYIILGLSIILMSIHVINHIPNHDPFTEERI